MEGGIRRIEKASKSYGYGQRFADKLPEIGFVLFLLTLIYFVWFGISRYGRK